MAPLISFDEALELGALTDHDEIGALVERAWEVRTRALRRLDRHVLAGQRQVGRLRRGLRLLRPVALRGGRHADARDDGAGADPRARARRPRRRAPTASAWSPRARASPSATSQKILEGAELVAEKTNLKRCASIGHMSAERAQAAARGGHPARPPQRRVLPLLLPGGLDDGPLRGPAAHDRRRQGGRARDLRRRHPQPRRVAAAAGRDGLRARRDQPDLGADQPAQPARRDQVRRPRADGSLGGRQVGRDLPADHPRRALPALRRPGREPRRAAAARRQGGPERGDDGQLPHHARRRARRGPRRCSRSWG